MDILVKEKPTAPNPALPSELNGLLRELLSVGSVPDFNPDWLPSRLRNLISTKSWGSQSDWLVIEQERIDRFGSVVEDFNYLHDAEAARQGPFGIAIAHGDLLSGLDTKLIPEFALLLGKTNVVRVDKYARFMRPVPAGSAVSMQMRVIESRHVPRRHPAGTKILFEFEALSQAGNKQVLWGFGTVLCTPK